MVSRAMKVSAAIICSCSFMVWCLTVSPSSPAVRGGEGGGREGKSGGKGGEGRVVRNESYVGGRMGDGWVRRGVRCRGAMAKAAM